MSGEITRVTVLNLTGKYVIPGLFDMHAHVAGVLIHITKIFQKI